jgi:tRNA-dihydrouridine synthase B
MEVEPNEHPISIQLFDCRPDFLAEAAIKAVEEGADTVDINMDSFYFKGLFRFVY